MLSISEDNVLPVFRSAASWVRAFRFEWQTTRWCGLGSECSRLLFGNHFDLEDFRPQLAGDEQSLAFGIVGDTV
jgi:hypothetical protein